MQVYIVLVVWQRDSGECGNEIVGVYDTIEKATQTFIKEIYQAQVGFRDLTTEEDNYVDGDMNWSIWEKGEYCFNHCDVSIIESQVQ